MSKDIEQYNIQHSQDDLVNRVSLVKVTFENGTIRVHDGSGVINLENLAVQSEDFTTTWSASGCSVTADQATGPDGATTADKLIYNGAADPFISQSRETGQALANRTFTSSCVLWTDAGQPTEMQLFIYDNSIGDVGSVTFNVTTTPTRYYLTHTFGSSEADTQLVVRVDGPATPATNEFQYAWGFTLQETGSYSGYYATTDTAKSSEKYIGIGQIGAISSVRVTPDIRPIPVTLSLSGIPNNILYEALNEDYYGNVVEVYSCFTDDNGKPLTTPALDWSGFIDTVDIQAGESSGDMTVTCESKFTFWDRANLRRYTDVDQQTEYAGDEFFEFLPQMMELELQWGGRNTNTGFSGAAGTGTSIFRSSTFNSRGQYIEPPSSQDDFPW